MIKKLKTALKELRVEKDVKLVNIEDTNLFAQINPFDYSANEDKYLVVNYPAYNKNKGFIFEENRQITASIKKYYANKNFARVLIHEFTHANEIAKSIDTAGYIELLKLNGKHDVTKLLLKAKLGLPEVRNNADSLAETIIILAETNRDPACLDDFLINYQEWEIYIAERISKLKESVELIVSDKTHLSWKSTSRSDIFKLKEEYNLEMCNKLISEISDSNKIFFDITGG